MKVQLNINQSFNSGSRIKILLVVIFCVIPYFIFSQEYKLVWQDDFNMPSIDTTTWTPRETGDGGGNNEIQFYLGANISIGKEPVTNESCLIITVKKEGFKGRPCTSGRVTTKGKLTFMCGKVVARIKMPKTANGTEKPNEPSRYFRKPFYLIFNVTVGGTYSEIYDINKMTALNDGKPRCM